MTSPTASEPNADQFAYWNEESGAKWVSLHSEIDAQIAPLGVAAMERAEIGPGESVLDVGCGCGDSSLQLSLRVGPDGGVTGLDISAVMIERARERAREAGRANLRFVHGDAQTFAFDGERYDRLFSRFGVMFFGDPVAAFANLRSALVKGGRLAFVCWQHIGRNPWMLVPVRAIAPHVALPPPPAEGAPGPFAFADPERVRGILTGAGFGDVAIDPLESEITLAGGGELDRAVDFVLQVGPAARALRDAGGDAPDRVRDSVREALVPFAGPQGVRMGCSAFVVTAASP